MLKNGVLAGYYRRFHPKTQLIDALIAFETIHALGIIQEQTGTDREQPLKMLIISSEISQALDKHSGGLNVKPEQPCRVIH